MLKSLIHLLASTSKHAYPALLDLINYFDKTNKLSNNIPFETINEIFKISLNFAETDEDINSIYSKWIRLLLRFSDNPFEVDVKNAVPDRAKHINETASLITKMIEENWLKDWNLEETVYNKIISKKDINSEILYAIKDNNYEPVFKNTPKDLDSKTLSALDLLFQTYYSKGKYILALEILNMFPKNWKTFWNAHLCDPNNNEYIDALIFMIGKEAEFKNKTALILQLEFKKLVNDIEGKLLEEDSIDPEIIKQISLELENDSNTKETNSDELIDKFTSKLYEKIVYNKAKNILNSIPENIGKDDLISIYIDAKKVMEFCIENGIEKASSALSTINKTLFEEINDVASGVALVEKMLKNNSHIRIAQHLTQLTHLVTPGSVEIEELFETLAKHISQQKLSTKQFKMYFEAFDNVDHPEFKVLQTMLVAFQNDQSRLCELADTITSNLKVFQTHSQSMYIIIEAVLGSGFKHKNTQAFISKMMTAELQDIHAKNLLRLMINYLHKNPSLNIRKELPVNNWNRTIINKLNGILEQIIYEAMEDPSLEAEFEAKKYAIYECRAFIDYLSIKTKEHCKEKGGIHAQE